MTTEHWTVRVESDVLHAFQVHCEKGFGKSIGKTTSLALALYLMVEEDASNDGPERSLAKSLMTKAANQYGYQQHHD